MKLITNAVLTLTLSATLPCLAQQTEVKANEAFEELPELKASEILKPEFLKGPSFTVREPVPTSFGNNQFVIDSDYGVFEADGNDMLLRRLSEIEAIGRLKEVSRTDQFKSALVKAAKSPLVSAKNIVTDPVNTVTSVPKGVFKFLGRTGENLKNIGKKEGKDPEGRKLEQLIGYSDTKRKLAVTLGVDPYSTNNVLQKELNGIAWASFAGDFAFTAATFPVSGPAGMALSVTSMSSSLNDMVRDKSPTDLQIMNRKALISMGVPEKDVDLFLKNNHFSPTAETAFVLQLQALDGVANRAAFVRTAAENSDEESDANFCVETAALMAKIHKEKPIATIAMIRNLPVCIAKDGTVILALQWDYAGWTLGASHMADEIKKLAANKRVFIALSGQASPRLQEELKNLGFAMRDRVAPGPLK